MRSDGKRSDGMSIVPWSSGKLLIWDVTCTDTFAPPNIRLAVSRMGAVAKKAEDLKMLKYLSLDSSYLFVVVAVERDMWCICPQNKEFDSRSWTSPQDSY